jgi:hypothetical protein
LSFFATIKRTPRDSNSKKVDYLPANALEGVYTGELDDCPMEFYLVSTFLF